MLPKQPDFIEMPFAYNGGRNEIPASGGEDDGLATLDQGFPIITEQPLSQGGIPPRRKDFNGILYALSNFCFFAQSGGVFTYDTTLNYRSPALVWYNNNFWICIKANGPDSTVVTPGTDSSYWKDFIDFLGLGSEGDIVANRLGTSTVGSGTKHIYLDSGSPKASGSTVGGTAQGMWLNAGTMTAMSASLGNSTTPCYMENGVWKACSREIPESGSGDLGTFAVALFSGTSGSGTSATALFDVVSGSVTLKNYQTVLLVGTRVGNYRTVNVGGTGSVAIRGETTNSNDWTSYDQGYIRFVVYYDGYWRAEGPSGSNTTESGGESGG